MNLLLSAILLFCFSIYAKTFTKYGSLEKVQYRPVNSPIEFKYDVFYYVPSKLKGKKNLKTLN